MGGQRNEKFRGCHEGGQGDEPWSPGLVGKEIKLRMVMVEMKEKSSKSKCNASEGESWSREGSQKWSKGG